MLVAAGNAVQILSSLEVCQLYVVCSLWVDEVWVPSTVPSNEQLGLRVGSNIGLGLPRRYSPFPTPLFPHFLTFLPRLLPHSTPWRYWATPLGLSRASGKCSTSTTRRPCACASTSRIQSTVCPFPLNYSACLAEVPHARALLFSRSWFLTPNKSVCFGWSACAAKFSGVWKFCDPAG